MSHGVVTRVKNWITHGGVGNLDESGNIAATVDADGKPLTLRKRTVWASIWQSINFAYSKGFRIVRSLILTRLLPPEVFGLMAIVQTILAGIKLFTDLGVGIQLISDERGRDPDFYNTAWSVGLLRSLALYVLVLLLSWPMSVMYGEPDLLWIMPMVGLTILLSGLSTNAGAQLSREVRLGRVSMFAMTNQAISFVVVVVTAWIYPTIWALVIGTLCTAAISLISSYIILPGFRNRWHWDFPIVKQFIRFGRWIFLSTVSRFFLTQGDNLLIGYLLTMTDLGIYALAYMISRAIVEFMLGYSRGVLLPVYSRLAEKKREWMAAKMTQLRWMLLGLTLPPLWALAIFGHHLIDFLYDDRYAAAGWMLQFLAFNGVLAIISSTAGSALLALNDSYRFMWVQVTRGSVAMIGMIVGYYFGGLPGLILGRALSNFLDYPVLAWALDAHEIWLKRQDLIAIVVSTFVVVAGIAFTEWMAF